VRRVQKAVENSHNLSFVEWLLIVFCSIGTILFLVVFATFAGILWSESIPMMRLVQNLYVCLVASTLAYGLFGNRRLLGLSCNAVLLGGPLIILIGPLYV
jgi:hypothetical protein